MAWLNQKYEQAIWAVTEALQQETQMESGLSTCLEIAKDTIDCEAGFVWLEDHNTARLMIVACGTGTDVTGVTIAGGQGIVGHVVETAEPMVLHGKTEGDRPLHESDDATGMIVRSQMVIPIRVPGLEAFGCIQLVNKKSGRFDEDDIRLAGNLASLVALDIEDKGYEIGEKKLLLDADGKAQKLCTEFSNTQCVEMSKI